MTSTKVHRIATERSGGMPVMADQPVGVSDVAGVGDVAGSARPGGPDMASISAIGVTGFPLSLPMEHATALIVGVLAVLDPSRLTGPDALRLYELSAGVERLALAIKTLLAPRIDESGVCRDHGHQNTTAMLAALEGVPTGQARNTLEVGQRLCHLPGTEDALRAGTLSGPKVTELSGAAILDPASETELLKGAAEQPLQQLKERCQRARATSADNDPVAAIRRIRANRNFTWWTDAEGAFCYEGRDTADRGAKILQQMDHTAGKLQGAEDRTVHPSGPEEPATTERNRRADALYFLVTGDTSARADRSDGPVPVPVDDSDPGPPEEQISSQLEFGAQAVRPAPARPGETADPGDPATVAAALTGTSPPDDVIDRPPSCSVMVRVDLDALLRGTTLPGETCEIDNFGPIPVAMAGSMANDSFLRFVFSQAGDIRAVSHFGRTINRHLRTALAHRDRCCVVPGCGVSYGLEIDHIQAFALGGPTELGNLAVG